MVEKLKGLGFIICAIALAFSNLGTFIAIAITGAAFLYEPTAWILYLEMALALGFIAWGFERLVKYTRR